MADPGEDIGSADPPPTGEAAAATAGALGGLPTTRAGLQARLERLVHEHRFTIAVVFPLVGAVSLVASAESLYPPALSVLEFNAAFILVGTVVMRLPLVTGLAPLVDRRAAGALAALTAYAYGIEYVGTTTGWPYGAFAYGVDLGPMIAGKVPLGLPVFFLPLVANAYLLCLLLLGERARSWLVRVLATVATVLAVDLVLDPGAVAIGFWTYTPPGPYYGVPASNYAGWVLSATVAVLALDFGFDHDRLLARLRECEFFLDDMVSFVLLWGGINAVYLQVLPLAVATLLGAGLVVADRFDVPAYRGPLPFGE
jgi:putative membrane protein